MPAQLLLRETEGHLATEHSLLDDNTDGEGTRVEALDESGDGYLAGVTWLRRTQILTGDPTLASERTALETQIAAIKSRKSQMGFDAYYAELETLFVAPARLYDRIEGELKKLAREPTWKSHHEIKRISNRVCVPTLRRMAHRSFT